MDRVSFIKEHATQRDRAGRRANLLSKPFAPSELAARVREALSR